MTFTQSIQAGNQQAWFMFYDSNGDPSGNTPTALASGTSAPSYHLRGIQTFPTGIPESEAVQIPGDDTSLGSILFSADTPREFLINFGQMDLTLEARLQNTSIEDVAGGKVGLIDTPASPASGALIIQSRAVKQTPGVAGQAGWSGLIYPYVQLQPLNRETFDGRTAGSIRYKGVAQQAFNKPWGVTVVDSGGAQTSAYAMPFMFSYPITFHAFRGAITSFTLDRTPINVASSSAFVDKVALTISSVNTPTPRLLTLSGASPADRPGIAIVQYQPA